MRTIKKIHKYRNYLNTFSTTLLILLFLVTQASAANKSKNKIRVVSRNFPPLIIQGNNSFSGFTGELFKNIAADNNLDYEVHFVSNTKELVNEIQSGKADIAIGGLVINHKLEKKIDFSHTYFESGLQMMVLSDNTNKSSIIRFLQNTSSVFTSPLLLKPLGILLILLFISANAVWFFERRKNPDMFPASYSKGIWESLWWSAVTLTTVGYGDKTPRGPVGRGFALVWMFTGIFLISFFTASISSSLTVQQINKKISSPYELAGKQVCTVKKSTSATYLRKIGARVFELSDIEKVYLCIKRGLVSSAVYDAPALRNLIIKKHYEEYKKATRNGKKNDKANQVVLSSGTFNKMSYGFAFANNSPLRETINLSLLKIKDSGKYQELYDNWFGKEDY